MAKEQLRKYRVTYKDANDPACGPFSMIMRGYSAEHVEMRFYDAPDADGWEIVTVTAVT